MKEKPIIFSSPMIQAILAGRKTQTRRIIKPQPNNKATEVIYSKQWIKTPWVARFKYPSEPECWEVTNSYKCPYGSVGDILWVRETWRKADGMPTGFPYEWKATAEQDGTPIEGPWKPSIFMPREACRIRLEITDIRVERVQYISEADAIDEGIESNESDVYKDYLTGEFYRHPKESYQSLWAKINGKESWNSNPWVWIVEFKRIQP
jgi:hypothetical protein